ncbi:hypothetical protein [Bradyrhizobium prioriisuperbiae]|uniref:hypothetical protein n=1 Tax=Bradyrhizobium prioriisuperbiae TaxID=2854389 RepID=UPI0028E5D660|nr:hypothetical protein [Bradyrhizobium prioritasuperba]
MLSTLTPKQTDPHADEIHLVARVEEELSKLAHEAAGHAAPAPSTPPPRVELPAPSERPVPPIDITSHPATDTAELASPKPADPRNDPHDFVPISPTLDESRPAQRAAPAFNPPQRVAPVFSPSRPARPVPPIEATFRPAARADESLNDPFLKGPLAGLSADQGPGPRDIPGQAREAQPPQRSWLRRVVTSFILALVGVGATYAWQHHGDEARAISEQMLAKWAPQVSLPSWLKFPGQSADQDPAAAAQAGQPPVQPAVAAAAPAPAQPAATPSMTLAAAPPAQDATPATATPAAATAAAAPAVSALPPEVTQQLQAMARDLARLQQTIDQLKAGQDQMAKEIAKLSDQDARRRVAAPPPPAPPRPASAPGATRTRPVAAMPPPPPITARRPYPTPPPSATPQATSPQPITPQNPSPQATAPRVPPPSPQSYDPDAATAPRPPRPLQSSEP